MTAASANAAEEIRECPNKDCKEGARDRGWIHVQKHIPVRLTGINREPSFGGLVGRRMLLFPDRLGPSPAGLSTAYRQHVLSTSQS
jgi:hypothetical protein